MITCSIGGCQRKTPNHKWAKIRAYYDGWFFSFDGQTAYCPEHLPSWVIAWRNRK